MTKPKAKAAKRNAPPPGSSSKGVKARKAAIVARGLIRGKTTAAIAREAGCCERHVQRLANENETRVIVADLMAPHTRALAKCIPDAIGAVRRAIKAKKKTDQDHFAQLQGVGKLESLLGLAQGKLAEDAGPPPTGITWERFQVMFADYKRQAPAPPPCPDAE